VAEHEYHHEGDGSATISIKALSFITAPNGQRSVILDINGETIVMHEWSKKAKTITVDAQVKASGYIEVLPRYA